MAYFSRYVAAASVLFAMVNGMSILHAQNANDLKTMEKAKAAYLTGPVPGSISCGVVLDWDGFFQRMKLEQTDQTKARLAKLKEMKIAVVSSGEQHTEVKIDPSDTSNNLADGLRNQLQGFFQIYWSLSYGRLLTVKPGDVFDITLVPEGYRVNMTSGSMKVTIDMDKTYAITHTNLESPQMNAVATPGFKPGDDGLLRMRSFDETINMGATTMVISIKLDYQKVGAFDIPQHIQMALPGSYSFDYTLTGCEVKESAAAAPATKN